MPPRPKKICQIQGQKKLTFNISTSASEDASVVGGKPKELLKINHLGEIEIVVLSVLE